MTCCTADTCIVQSSCEALVCSSQLDVTAVGSACYLCCTLGAPHLRLQSAWETQSRRVLCYWLNQNHKAGAPLYSVVVRCPWRNVIHSHPRPVLLSRVTLLQICSSIRSVFFFCLFFFWKKDWSRRTIQGPGPALFKFPPWSLCDRLAQ